VGLNSPKWWYRVLQIDRKQLVQCNLESADCDSFQEFGQIPEGNNYSQGETGGVARVEGRVVGESCRGRDEEVGLPRNAEELVVDRRGGGVVLRKRLGYSSVKRWREKNWTVVEIV